MSSSNNNKCSAAAQISSPLCFCAENLGELLRIRRSCVFGNTLLQYFNTPRPPHHRRKYPILHDHRCFSLSFGSLRALSAALQRKIQRKFTGQLAETPKKKKGNGGAAKRKTENGLRFLHLPMLVGCVPHAISSVAAFSSKFNPKTTTTRRTGKTRRTARRRAPAQGEEEEPAPTLSPRRQRRCSTAASSASHELQLQQQLQLQLHLQHLQPQQQQQQQKQKQQKQRTGLYTQKIWLFLICPIGYSAFPIGPKLQAVSNGSF